MAETVDTGVVVPMTARDLEGVVEAHRLAFEGYMNTVLGRRYLTAFYGWFLENQEAICLTAHVEDKVVGFVIGAPVGYGAAMNRDLFRPAVRAILLHPGIFAHPRFMSTLTARLKILLSPNDQAAQSAAVPHGRGISLVGIAVAPEAQGQGIGRRLIEAFEERAIKAGYGFQRLSVFASNVAACQMYERTGWRIQSENGGTLTYGKHIGGRS